MKLNLFLIICFATLISCKKSNNPTVVPPSIVPPSVPVDIYIAGVDNGKPLYWKNGMEIFLPSNYNNYNSGGANSITISNNDIYLSGCVTSGSGEVVAAYWKNGVLNILPGVNDTASIVCALSIAVSGNNVYTGGYQDGPYVANGAILWKNGVPGTAFGSAEAQVVSLFANQDDIYLAGPGESFSSVSYYKNGVSVPLTLSEDAIGAVISSVFVSGNDVYVAGTQTINKISYATYWKNGVPVTLSSAPSSVTYSIFVLGSDVYVGGAETINQISTATIWKNGTVTHLTSNIRSICYDVKASGSNVYAVGFTVDASTGHDLASFWKNGVATSLSTSFTGSVSIAQNIFLNPQ
jgi:hypothetical protein